MRSMREKMFRASETLGERLANGIGNVSISISEKSVRKCGLLGIYEPKIPIEIIEENIKK